MQGLTQEGTQQDQHDNHTTKLVDYDEADKEEPEKELQFEKSINSDEESLLQRNRLHKQSRTRKRRKKKGGKNMTEKKIRRGGMAKTQEVDKEKDDQENDNDDPMTVRAGSWRN